MFDEVTKQEGGKRAARKSAFLAASTVFQVLFVVAIIFVGDQLRAAATGTEPIVDVKFVKMAPPPPPPPPPAPRRRPPQQKPKTEIRKPVTPMAMIQPKDVPAELKPPDPNEKVEEEEDYGSDEGVEGGVIGGVVGGQPQSSGIEEAPAYATAGFKKPAQAHPRCVENAVRIPKDLQGYVSGPITVKFAITKTGQPTYFQVMTQVPDKRISDAIWNAIAGCQWIPGADAQGRPTAIWVILPIKFVNG